MKRKLFLFAIAALSVCVMASCGKKSSKDKDEKDDTELVENEEEDEEELDADEEVADGVEVAPEEDWTAEAVADVIRKAYADASLLYAPSEDGMEANIDVFGMYCAESFNELLRKVRAIDAQQSDPADRFFQDENLTWNYWGEGSVEPKYIEVRLNTGNMAQATFRLTHGEEWLQTEVTLFYENGQWRIDDWVLVGDNAVSLAERMYEYVEQNK